MKILYLASKYDYGKFERGFSFEHYNFYDSLLNMGNDIVYFDYMAIMKKIGKKRMNNLLRDVFKSENPDLVFVFLFEYELDLKTLSELSRSKNSVTLNWFADDQWRFENYSRFCAPHFNWVVTTDLEAVRKYHAVGYKNVILSQWACNHFLYKKLEKRPKYDVSFIGQAYGDRRETIDSIKRSGINIIVKGQGWTNGRVGQEEMIEIFNSSKINLNLANASIRYLADWVVSVDRIGLYTPGLRRGWRKLRSMLPNSYTGAQNISQIKGRNFEVPGCGGFLLTDYVRGLENYYLPDIDIVCYTSREELLNKIRYYLVNDKLREEIAKNGWQRTLENHTYVHRFEKIFQEIGLKFDFSLAPRPGRCTEVDKGV